MAAIYPILTGDQALVLGREQFIRKMSIGYNWSQLRLSMRCMTYGSGGAFVAQLRFGLTTSLKQYDDPAADLVYLDCGGGGWQNLSNGNHASYRSLGCGFRAKLGASITTGANATDNTDTGTPYYCSFGSYPTHYQHYWTLTRSGATITGQMYSKGGDNQGPAIADQTQENFFDELEASSPSLLNTSYAASGATSYAGAGLLDSIFVMWTANVPVLIINDLAVCRYS